MNTKKIWLYAIIFGLIMSLSFLMLTSMNAEIDSPNTPGEVSEDEELTEPVTDRMVIEAGKRAISIPVDEIQSVSGFVKPGSYVDIVSVLENSVSQILVQNVKVLAVGKTLVENEIEDMTVPYSMVTLELTPTDGSKLTLARQNGIIMLMLRGVEDQEPSPPAIISLEQLTKEQMPS